MGSRVLILEKEQNEVDEVFEHFEESENIVVLSEFLRKEHDLKEMEKCKRTDTPQKPLTVFFLSTSLYR